MIASSCRIGPTSVIVLMGKGHADKEDTEHQHPYTVDALCLPIVMRKAVASLFSRIQASFSRKKSSKSSKQIIKTKTQDIHTHTHTLEGSPGSN